MRRWMLAVVVTSVGLVGGVSVLAQRSEEAPAPQPAVPPPDAPLPPVAPREAPSLPREELPPVAPMPEEVPPPVSHEPRSKPQATGIPDDPMEAVEAFVVRNRKEADESIKALTQEAGTLRARLAKVEAALGRWKSVAEALDQKPAREGAVGEPGFGEPPPGLDPILPPPPAVPGVRSEPTPR